MNILEFVKGNILLFDGAMGSELVKRGLKSGEVPEILNIENPSIIKEVHKEYIKSGANVITTNTFGANEIKLATSKYKVEEIIESAVEIAKTSIGENKVWIALDIGPIGKLLEPVGSISFDKAYEIFKRQVLEGVKSGVDIILIETMSDLCEARAAVLAAKENSDLPVFCTMSFESGGKTFMGCKAASMAISLSGLGVDAIGINCSLGPKEMLPIIEEILDYTDLPIMVQPNAGLPTVLSGETIYNISDIEFKDEILKFIKKGVTIVGGCCGTTPQFIRNVSKAIKELTPLKREIKKSSVVCTASKVLELDGVNIIGERINVTGRILIKEALITEDFDYIVDQAIEQLEAGADIIDINISLAEIEEKSRIKSIVMEIQGVANIPIQIDSCDVEVIETALRYYNGKAIVNSVNGDDETLDKILPLVKKYGSAVIGLTIDSNGVPSKAKDRVKIAEKILDKAIGYGIKKEDVFIDVLALPVAIYPNSLNETMEALRIVNDKLGVKTVLGILNVSYGLSKREVLNEAFLSIALSNGLDMPILNPLLERNIEIIEANNILKGKVIESEKHLKQDENKTNYGNKDVSEFNYLIENALRDKVEEEIKRLLKEHNPKDIIDSFILPSLDHINNKYENNEMFLPQFIQASESIKKAFEIIKEDIELSGSNTEIRENIILATVKGDSHTIGKDLIRIVIESYGYNVLDLGVNVSGEEILEKANCSDVVMIGLSAMMTTSLQELENIVKLLKNQNLEIKIFIGGIAVNSDYAKKINADYYIKDIRALINLLKSGL